MAFFTPLIRRVLLGVTVVILSLLPVLFFVFSQEKKDNDLIKVAHISLIHEKIDQKIRSGASLPIPTNALKMQFGQTLLGYQGRAGRDLFLSLGIEHLQDPDNGESYHYFLRPDTGEYEVLALLQNATYANTYIGDTPAYTSGSVKGKMLIINAGKNIGKLVSSVITSSQSVDLNDPEKREQIGWKTEKSCHDILLAQPKSSSGKYVIGVGNLFEEVYCDMKTDGGGWTLWYANNGHPESPLKASYVSMRESLGDHEAPVLSEYEDPYLAGMIDYRDFTRQGSHEILIKNRTGNPNAWVKMSFDSSQSLEYALGPDVLGKSDTSCVDIPQSGWWSITSNDEKIVYEKLSQIMTHGGVNWGVSHSNYWCNDYIGNAHPHIAFYSAMGDADSSRTRSNLGVGGSWGGKNEYRYFIR